MIVIESLLLLFLLAMVVEIICTRVDRKFSYACPVIPISIAKIYRVNSMLNQTNQSSYPQYSANFYAPDSSQII